jgi:hypothetical protein
MKRCAPLLIAKTTFSMLVLDWIPFLTLHNGAAEIMVADFFIKQGGKLITVNFGLPLP